MALSQLDPKNAGKPPSRLPHFCWGTPDFNIDRIIRALAEMQAPAQAVLREGKTINGINFDDPDGFPLQFNPVTACGGGGFLGDVCDASAKPDRLPNDPPAIPVRTLNHVKLIVPNLQRTLDWYLKLTDMKLKGAEPGDNGSEIRILRVGPGPQFVALSEGSGPAASRSAQCAKLVNDSVSVGSRCSGVTLTSPANTAALSVSGSMSLSIFCSKIQ